LNINFPMNLYKNGVGDGENADNILIFHIHRFIDRF
jgi:hypothetical protein